jgi:energy-coupling factor transporter transmembrane protein EcfT
MVSLSKILFFTSHHGFYTVIILFLVFGLLSAVTKKPLFLLPIIPLAILNGFAGQFLNAWFLNKYGVESTAIITSDVETNSTLNDQYIHDYEAIVKKKDGKYVSTFFSTMSAAIYPIENAIRIPQVDKPFPVKYIPGYEKNIVILYNQSDEGKTLQKYELQAPVNSAKIKYDADPSNKEFVEEYISALENYLKNYDDPGYKTKLDELKKELGKMKE